MAVTAVVTSDIVQPTRIGRHGGYSLMTGAVATSGTYATGGFAIDLSDYFVTPKLVLFEQMSGYTLEYDDTNELVLVYVGGAAAHTHSFTGTAQADLDMNVMDDDSAASNGTAVYAALERGKTQDAMLWSETANGATALATSDTGALSVPVLHRLTQNSVIKGTDADGAAGTGVQLYAVLTQLNVGWNNSIDIAVLQCVNAGNANSSFAVATPTDTFDVFDNDGAATAGIAGLPTALAVTLDEDAASTSGRLLVNNTITGNDVYVRSQVGRYLKLTHASSGGVAVYFDDDAGTATDRLLFVSPTDANMTDGSIGHTAGLYAVEGWWLGQLYCDDDAVTESQRLLFTNAAAVDVEVATLSGNRLLKLVHSGTASSTGAAVYFDDDAVDATERLLSVTAGDADTTVQLDTDLKRYGQVDAGANASNTAGAADEMTAGTTLTLSDLGFIAIGTTY